MKRILYSVAAIAVAMGTMYAGTAQAAGSCEQNLKEVKTAWKAHLDGAAMPPQASTGEGGVDRTTIQSVINHGEKDCLAGRDNEANENLALARRHMGIKEFRSGK